MNKRFLQSWAAPAPVRMMAVFAMALAMQVTAWTPARALPPVEAFAMPMMTQVRISPDGTHIAALQPVGDRFGVVVYEIGGGAMPLASGDDIDVDWFGWATNDRLVIRAAFVGERRGVGYRVETRETRLIAINRDGSRTQVLFRVQQGEQAITYQGDVISMLPNDPDHIMVGMMMGRDGFWNANKVNIHTGRAFPAARGGVNTRGYLVDANGDVRARIDFNDNNFAFYLRDPARPADWRQFYSFQRFRDATAGLYAVSKDGNEVYMHTNETGRRALYRYRVDTGQMEMIFGHDKVDISNFLYSQKEQKPLAVSYTVDIPKFHFFDDRARRRHEMINNALPEAVAFISSSNEDETRHIITALGPSDPPAFYLFDETVPSISEIALAYPNLDPAQMASVRPYPYRARDGVEIPAYLTTPRNMGSGPQPLVVLPHGGPQSRDTMLFDFLSQFIASRGYMVLQPNFRGSTGYGVEFEQAGYKQWGLRMQDDVTDGVKALIAAGLADPNRICIAGWSYGGYAALMGAVKDPDLYRCAIGINGVYDLVGLQSDLTQDRARQALAFWRRTMGDYQADRDYMIRSSPARRAGEIRAAVLLVHSREDRVAPFRETERMISGLQSAGVAHESVLLDYGDHSLNYRPSRVALLRAMERFLAQQLGGRSSN